MSRRSAGLSSSAERVGTDLRAASRLFGFASACFVSRWGTHRSRGGKATGGRVEIDRSISIGIRSPRA